MLNPTGDSAEIVALALLERVARSEGRQFDGKPEAGTAIPDRQWICDPCGMPRHRAWRVTHRRFGLDCVETGRESQD